MMDGLTKFMEKIKKQNPNANWANLLTGVAVLVMVAVFSYAYFSRPKSNTTVDLNRPTGEVSGGNTTNEVGGGAQGNDGNTGSVETTPEVPAEPGEKGAAVTSGTTVVQKGEGLWQVAQRVCGDGEKYNILANANGLSVWEGLREGMTLKVVCN